MSKYKSKFGPALQKEFPFLKQKSGSEIFCTLCDSKFNIANWGRAAISDHLKTGKHIKGSQTIQGNQSLDDLLIGNSTTMLLQAKELAFAYHAGKHRMSGPTADFNARL